MIFWNRSLKWSQMNFNERPLMMFCDRRRRCKLSQKRHHKKLINIFFSSLDLIVLLERLNIERATFITSNLEYKKSGQSETLEDLEKKGNDGLTSKDPHTCCIFQKVISNRAYLRRHLETVHLRQAKMSCDLCPKFFFAKNSIKHHMKVHGKQRFACNICDFKAKVKQSLIRHKLTHAVKVGCPICNKQVSSLDCHMIQHRPKVSCPICAKMVTKKQMKLHMKTHVKKCRNCQEVFENLEDLKRYKRKKHVFNSTIIS